jgi:hypothetical protein
MEVGFVSFGKPGLRKPGAFTLTSRHAHKSRTRSSSVGSSGPTFRNPQAIGGARARKSPESLDIRTIGTNGAIVWGYAPKGVAFYEAVEAADRLLQLAALDPEFCRQFRQRAGTRHRGADEDFHRGEHHWKLASATAPSGGNGSLGTVEEPPFYGIALHPAGGSSVGLLTDVHGQVIHQRRRPIPGLYAAGNAAAATEQGIGYQAGLSLASAMTFSYLAVRHMLDAAG